MFHDVHLLEVAFSEFWSMSAPKHVSLQCLCLWAVSASRRGNKVNALETYSNTLELIVMVMISSSFSTQGDGTIFFGLSHFHYTDIHFMRVALCWCLFWFHGLSTVPGGSHRWPRAATCNCSLQSSPEWGPWSEPLWAHGFLSATVGSSHVCADNLKIHFQSFSYMLI